MTQPKRIDATGLLCPLPVLKLAKVMKRAEVGAVVELCADDPAAVIDVPHYCTESGNTLLGTTKKVRHVIYRVQKQ
ncbi:MAG: sulfurtransferase TusA family protein [Pseudomonadota bacterium]